MNLKITLFFRLLKHKIYLLMSDQGFKKIKKTGNIDLKVQHLIHLRHQKIQGGLIIKYHMNLNNKFFKNVCDFYRMILSDQEIVIRR